MCPQILSRGLGRASTRRNKLCPVTYKNKKSARVLTSEACPESPSGSLADQRTPHDAPRGPLSARKIWIALSNFWFQTFFHWNPPPLGCKKGSSGRWECLVPRSLAGNTGPGPRDRFGRSPKVNAELPPPGTGLRAAQRQPRGLVACSDRHAL